LEEFPGKGFDLSTVLNHRRIQILVRIYNWIQDVQIVVLMNLTVGWLIVFTQLFLKLRTFCSSFVILFSCKFALGTNLWNNFWKLCSILWTVNTISRVYANETLLQGCFREKESCCQIHRVILNFKG